jgi:hypothetical protein
VITSNGKTLTTTAAFAALVIAGVLGGSAPAGAADDAAAAAQDGWRSAVGDGAASQDEKRMIRTGLDVASSSGIALNLKHKDADMVGLGSYLVNVAGDCNGCHSNPPTTFTAGGNPYFLPGANPPTFNGRKQIDPKTYLGGNQSFGFFGPGPAAEIISRNLTPDKTGRPEGGNTLSDFLLIMRTGVDLDRAHPSCSSTVTTDCLAFPFNGALLQVMPWPAFQNMTERQLTAIYVYLSAIPCLEGGPGEPANRCN